MPKAAQLNRAKTDYSVHSVENALDLLDAICDEGGEARVSQLSQRLGMSKASVFRLLATFENRGFVERSDDSLKYRLGLSACEMGQKIIARMGVLRKVRPTMDRLARKCNESVYFVVRRNDYLLMLDMVDSVQQVKIVALVGQRFPLATTAAGRIFLAFEGDGVDTARKRIDAPGVVTMTPIEREAVRNCGFCIDEHGFGEGVTCVAVPLFSGKGQVAAALAILGPSYRMTGERIDNEVLLPLREAGGAISAGLGYLGNYLREHGVS
jgi:DNA-binding IclR family transcriptional regulator